MRTLFLFALLLTRAVLFGQELRILDRPIVWDTTRARLSLEYLEKRHGIVQSEPVITPRMVVVHWTAIPTLEASFRAFDPVELKARPELVNASTLNVSVPYLVDRDGTVYRLMPDTLFGRHCIGLNYMSIGIENVGDGRKHKLTKAQLEANVLLIRQLFAQYPIEYLIGHHEYLRFKTTDLWKETDPNYFTNKVDPGKKFMRQLRKRLKDLTPIGPPR